MRRLSFILSGLLLSVTSLQAQQVRPALTPAQTLIANTGEDSMNSYGASHSKTVLSGYGDVAYQRDANAKTSTLNLNRAVLFIGHQFTGRIAFFSELEVEDAKLGAGGSAGEIAMEQAYIKFALNPRQYFVAGLFLPRIGLINENHLPINYNGVERPLVEKYIIPSTWRELGVGFYGQSTAFPLNYSVAIINGLNNAGFQQGTGIRDGRAEGQEASANNLAFTAALQYFAGNWKFQGSAYVGGSTTLSPRGADTMHLQGGILGAPVYLAEASIQYANNGFSIRALGCNISIPQAESINNAYGQGIASQVYGAYAEAAYNLLNNAKKDHWKTKTLNLFARYELLDLNAKVPVNATSDATLRQSHIIAGLGYFPIPHVTIKADVRLLSTGSNPPATTIGLTSSQKSNTFINLGIGYSF